MSMGIPCDRCGVNLLGEGHRVMYEQDMILVRVVQELPDGSYELDQEAEPTELQESGWYCGVCGEKQYRDTGEKLEAVVAGV